MTANINREFHGIAERAAKAVDALATLKKHRVASRRDGKRRRLAEIVAQRQAGMSLEAIGRQWGVTRQRIFQILARVEQR